jgi:class 3 adenylate cyclase
MSSVSPMKICYACGAQNVDNYVFCAACGSPADTDEQHETRFAVVLVAGITGSTEAAERFDPESLRHLLGTYTREMVRAIETYGGFVEKFLGDSVLAVFGFPFAHEDDANRALRAALKIQTSIADLNADLRRNLGDALAIGIGVDMGELVVTSDSRLSQVAGHPVNVAARMAATAEPGQILVSEQARRAAMGFHFVSHADIPLKGGGRGIALFELTGEARLAADVLPFPMVGREVEFARLRAVYVQVVSRGQPSIVIVQGEAGIGKSRLVHEFLASLRAQDLVLRGRCIPYGEGVAYWPLADILRQHAQLDFAETAEDWRRRVTDFVEELAQVQAPVDVGRTVAALLLTVGVEDAGGDLRQIDPRHVREEVFAAWQWLLSALARTSTTVVVIEDLQWAESPFAEVIAQLVELSEGPLLFILTTREGLGGGVALERLVRSVLTIRLEPLPLEDAARLLTLVKDNRELSRELADRILDRAAGNPLFLEEMARLVQEADGLDALTLPTSIHALIAKRIERISPEERRVLEASASVGRTFWSAAVAAATGSTEAEIERILARLNQRQLITSTGESVLEGEREYRFRHILIRDVAYASLEGREKAQLHELVAGWIASGLGRWQPPPIELLAAHLQAAFENAKDEPGVLTEQIEHLRTQAVYRSAAAAERALRGLSFERARELARAALSLARLPFERARALEALGLTSYYEQDAEQAWKYFREAVDSYLVAQDEDGLVVAALCARALEVLTRFRGTALSVTAADARKYLDVGLANAGTTDSDDLAQLLMVKSLWPYLFPDGDRSDEARQEALEAGERAAAMSAHLVRPDIGANALEGVAAYHVHSGLYGRMRTVIADRLRLAGSLRDPTEVGNIFAEAARVEFHVGRYREAQLLADEAFSRSLESAPAIAVYSLGFRAQARCRLGDWDGVVSDVAATEELLAGRGDLPPLYSTEQFAAAAFVREVQGDSSTSDRLTALLERALRGDRWQSARVALWLALRAARKRSFDEAWAHLDRLDQQARQSALGLVLEAKCEIVAEEQAWNRSAAIVAEARHHSRDAKLIALPFYADRLEGRALLASGDVRKAQKPLARAANGFRQLEAKWETARSMLYFAEAMLQVRRQRVEMRAHLLDARQVLEELHSLPESTRAQWLLEKMR